jgi:hypothetical protein
LQFYIVRDDELGRATEAKPMTAGDLRSRSFAFRFAVRVARLAASVQ